MFPQKVAVREMNPHLICTLCGGYFIDATTIIECLHSFCKSCIVKHLETSKYCPICDVQVHKTRPLENIRPDHILQEIVYKLVPGLYQNEMRCRREFYRKNGENVPASHEAKGEISDECSIFFPEESIMLSLEYNNDGNPSNSHESSCGKRYLQCPAAVTILHLQKLIRSKFGLTQNCKVNFFSKDELLPEFLSLLDIAYIFQWRRKTPLHLSYQILEVKSQIIKPDPEVKEESAPASENVIPSETDKITSLEVAPKVGKVEKEGNEKWQEVQLQISENGVMSAEASSKYESKEKPTEKEKSSKPEAKTENTKQKVLTSEERTKVDGSKLICKESQNTAPKQKLKNEVLDVRNTPVKTTCEVSVTTVKSTAHGVSSPRMPQKDTIDNLKAEVSISISRDNVTKVYENSKANDKVCKPREVQKPESEDLKVRSNDSNVRPNDSNVKSESIWKPTQSVDKSKKVCKVEPSLMGLPCGLSIIQRPAMKTYPGSKATAAGKEPVDGLKAIAGLSKEVSIKPIVSISTSSAPLLNKTDVSSSLKIPSSAPPIVPPSLSKKPTPIRYKTLKSPTKPWNPSIPRSALLMMKHNSEDPNQLKTNVKPPKFFKMRNVPRYLGAPASGVKPLYQAAETSTTNCEPPNKLDMNAHKSGNSSVTLMKIDPKTLSPIVVSSACSSPSLSPNSTVTHPKKSPLPPPYTPGSPKQSPMSKSKPIINNKTPAHGTPIPSPAHSSSMLSPNSFFSAANPLMYPGFPHPFSHPDSANRLLASAATSPDLMRAMSSLCSPAFHPSLSILFNSHQVGFPSLSPPSKPMSKNVPPKQSPPVPSSVPLSISVSSPNIYTPTLSKPKKPIMEQMRTRPNLTVETSRYNVGCANGFLPSPTERHSSPKVVGKSECDKKVSKKPESVAKSKPDVKPAPVDKSKVEKMELDYVNPSKKEGKNTLDCDMPVSSNKRLKRDDALESNNNFKEDMNVACRKPTDNKSIPAVSKGSDIKSESNPVSRPNDFNSVNRPFDPSSVSRPKESNLVHQSSEPSVVNQSKECSFVNPSKESNINRSVESSSGQSTEPSVASRPKSSSSTNQTNDTNSVCQKNDSTTVNVSTESSPVTQLKEVKSDKERTINENRNDTKEKNKENGDRSKIDSSSLSNGNKTEIAPVEENSTVANKSSVEIKDKTVIPNDSNKLSSLKENTSISENSSNSENFADQTNNVSKSEVSLNTVNNNCKALSDTKKIDCLTGNDPVNQVN
ncbi:unnamed protein product [Bemisia tabaci]|uniref:RING-type domain-containing protein n=1 Tax=Bemisia tabaci TaxID=7038 RepID=A0A9P0F1W6_BEMTA|nr:unnamed protein product [Bemisia tabaci]